MSIGRINGIKKLIIIKTRNRTQLSFKNKRTFYNRIDNLPRGTQWECESFEGDELDEKGLKRKEILHLWKRDPVECIRELIGNPAFRNQMRFAPEKAYEDSDGKNRIFDEMWSGDWWWDLQVSACCLALQIDILYQFDRSIFMRELQLHLLFLLPTRHTYQTSVGISQPGQFI